MPAEEGRIGRLTRFSGSLRRRPRLARAAQPAPPRAQEEHLSWSAGPGGREWSVSPSPPGPCGIHAGGQDTRLDPAWCGLQPGRHTLVVPVDADNDAAVAFRPELAGCWPLPANLELQARPPGIRITRLWF